MKRKTGWLLLLLIVTMLAASGCQSQQAAEQKKEKLPLREAMNAALKDSDGLIAYTADDLADLMGILPEDYDEAVFLVGSDSLSGREAIAVRAKDAGALEKAKSALERYLAQRKEETQNYLPEAYKLQTEAKVETKGSTAVLIVGVNGADETKAFLAGE